MATIRVSEPIGPVAAHHAGARDLFEQLGIDYYCAGNLSIEEALQAEGIPVDPVEEKLRAIAAGASGPSWDDRPLSEIVRYLEREHNGMVRTYLFKVAMLFGDACAETSGDERLVELRTAFRHFSSQLIVHIEREEHTIFPTVVALEDAWTQGKNLPAAPDGGIHSAVARLMVEHGAIARDLQHIEMLRSSIEEIGSETCRVLAQLLTALERNVHHYINLENYVAFPRAVALEDAVSTGAGTVRR